MLLSEYYSNFYFCHLKLWPMRSNPIFGFRAGQKHTSRSGTPTSDQQEAIGKRFISQRVTGDKKLPILKVVNPPENGRGRRPGRQRLQGPGSEAHDPTVDCCARRLPRPGPGIAAGNRARTDGAEQLAGGPTQRSPDDPFFAAAVGAPTPSLLSTVRIVLPCIPQSR